MDKGNENKKGPGYGRYFSAIAAAVLLQGGLLLCIPWAAAQFFPRIPHRAGAAAFAGAYLVSTLIILHAYSCWLRRKVGKVIFRIHRMMKEWAPGGEKKRTMPRCWGIGYYLNNLISILPEMEELFRRRRTILEKSWYIREVVIHLNNLIFSLERKEDLFHEILRKALETIPNADHGSMMVLRTDGRLDYTAAVGFDLSSLQSIHLRLKDTYLYRLSGGRCKRPVLVRNKQVFDAEAQNQEVLETLDAVGSYDYSSTLTAPIIVGQDLYGILNVDSDDFDAFGEDDVVMMEYFTNQMGVAIRNHNLMEKALQQSRFDGLTQLCNRQYFEELITLVAEQSRRNGQGFQLVIFDLNDFKPVNDQFGHGTGDELIRVFAAALAENKRETDVVGRLGGDEFIAAYLYCTAQDVDRKMEEIRRELAERPVKGFLPQESPAERNLTVAFSYGTAAFPEEGTGLQELITLADERMYRNKQAMKAGR